MQDVEALFGALRQAADPTAVAAIEALVREGRDQDLARVNALQFAEERGLGEDDAISALLHATRLGLFEMVWNILCPSCGGVLDANATLKTIRRPEYHCAFCQIAAEPVLDDVVEVDFAISARVRSIPAHEPARLPFWDYHRQVFFGSGVVFPGPDEFDEAARRTMLDQRALGPGERTIVSLELTGSPVVVFDPVTHSAEFIEVAGEPERAPQQLTMLFDPVRSTVGRATLRPGRLDLTLDNITDGRVLPGIYLAGPDLEALIGGRRPYLSAKRLLSNQTFRDLYRTDTLDVDQRLKILSLTFLFTDLKGSTALYDQVGDLVAYDLVRAHFHVLHEIVASEGGAVVKTIGDAVMATFPLPHQAVAAALRMRASMETLNRERGGRDLVLKIGIHEGPCLAVSLNDRQDYFGQTVNIASRVQQLADTDRIYASGSVVEHSQSARLLASRAIAPTPQTRSLRGVGERIAVFELA